MQQKVVVDSRGEGLLTDAMTICVPASAAIRCTLRKELMLSPFSRISTGSRPVTGVASRIRSRGPLFRSFEPVVDAGDVDGCLVAHGELVTCFSVDVGFGWLDQASLWSSGLV